MPAWSVTPPRDPETIDTLAQAFTESNYDMRSVLRVLFNADFFKEARFAKLKSPAKVVIGTLRLVGGDEFPAPGIGNLSRQVGYMGQELLNPPSVEGWHTGTEWINSGSLMRRINFTASMVGDVNRPEVQAILDKLRTQGELSPEALVNICLDLMGPLDVNEPTRQELIKHTSVGGPLSWSTPQASEASTERVGELLQLIVSLRDYQFA